MKKTRALKDCFWRVSIKDNYGIYWSAVSESNTGLEDNILCQDWASKSKEESKQNWEAFAKLNDLKKWEFV